MCTNEISTFLWKTIDGRSCIKILHLRETLWRTLRTGRSYVFQERLKGVEEILVYSKKGIRISDSIQRSK